MAKTIPNSKGKINTNFSKIAKELKGKVGFDIDLRKTDKNPSIPSGSDTFNFGQRMALLKAFREYREFRNSTNFVPITRQAKESKKAYKERVRNTKREMGQTGSHFKGVWIDTPDFSAVSQKRTKNEKGKWTTEIVTSTKGRRIQLDVGFAQMYTKEKFIAIDPAEFARHPKKVLNEIRKKYGKSDFILPIHSGHRGTGSGFDAGAFEKFSSKIIKWSNEYKGNDKKKDNWLTGFLIVDYVIKPEKGAMGNPVVFKGEKWNSQNSSSPKESTGPKLKNKATKKSQNRKSRGK